MFLLRLKWRKSGHSSSFCPVFSEPGLRLYALLQEIATASHSDSLTATKLLAFSRLPNYYVTTLPKNGNGHAPIQTGCPRCSSCQTCCWSARECRRDTEETDCGLQICSCTRVRRNSLCSRIILQSSETLAAAGAFTVTHTCTNKLEFLKEIFVSNHWKTFDATVSMQRETSTRITAIICPCSAPFSTDSSRLLDGKELIKFSIYNGTTVSWCPTLAPTNNLVTAAGLKWNPEICLLDFCATKT